MTLSWTDFLNGNDLEPVECISFLVLLPCCVYFNNPFSSRIPQTDPFPSDLLIDISIYVAYMRVARSIYLILFVSLI
jgi:hypothetical protein